MCAVWEEGVSQFQLCSRVDERSACSLADRRTCHLLLDSPAWTAAPSAKFPETAGWRPASGMPDLDSLYF